MITDAFATLKSRLELNSSFDEKIQSRHAAVRSVLNNIETGIETKLIGSLARKTRIQPRPEDTFDIDILVIQGTFNQWASSGGLTADQGLENFLKTVQKSERYASMNLATDKPTINISYQDNTKVELVPAYLDNIGCYFNGTLYQPKGRAYWVPKHTGWDLADYDYDAQHVSSMNSQCGGWLVPSIKMLKALKRKWFPALPSFYFEMLVTKVLGEIVIPSYRTSGATLTYPLLIERFFYFAGDWLIYPMSFSGSLTKPISIDSTMAQSTKQTIAVIRDYIQSIESVSSDTEKQRMWRRLFEDPFPAV